MWRLNLLVVISVRLIWSGIIHESYLYHRRASIGTMVRAKNHYLLTIEMTRISIDYCFVHRVLQRNCYLSSQNFLCGTRRVLITSGEARGIEIWNYEIRVSAAQTQWVCSSI